jgi:two-component system, sensor histidine kinase and response regulator
MEAKRTILIVDDDSSLRLGLSVTLQRKGYSIITASNGQDGLEKIRALEPDLILCDVMMPPPNGFELRKLLASEPASSKIPFIFVTARTGVEDRINGIDEGADDYITKPFEPQELVARIEAVFRRIELEQARGREQMKSITDAELEKFKKEVLQNFHHELRTPLTNILLPLETILTHKFDNAEEQTRFIRMALTNADRLESLSTDFILLSNIDHGGLSAIRQPVDIKTNFLPAVRRRLERYKAKDIQFATKFSVLGEISAPRKELTHVVIHLLDNAFKFSPEHGSVELAISSNEDGDTTIRISDEGPGIPVNLREKVFERFFQGSQGDARDHEGLGVGLTIAKAVLEKIGGSIKILDTARGCSVQIYFPGYRPGDMIYG